MRLGATLLLAALAAGPVSAAAPGDEAAVLDAQSRRLDAMVRSDAAAMGRLIADDAIYVHASGAVDTKASLIQSITSGARIYHGIERSEAHVRLYGNVAVVTGKTIVRVQSAATGNATIPLLFTDVYARTPGGAWQMVSWHSTRQPDAPAAPVASPSPAR
jgi:ketosteroid isomerase-like protein